MTQAERRGAALRAQADAALDFKFETGQAQDATAYAGGSRLACPVLLIDGDLAPGLAQAAALAQLLLCPPPPPRAQVPERGRQLSGTKQIGSRQGGCCAADHVCSGLCCVWPTGLLRALYVDACKASQSFLEVIRYPACCQGGRCCSAFSLSACAPVEKGRTSDYILILLTVGAGAAHREAAARTTTGGRGS